MLTARGRAGDGGDDSICRHDGRRRWGIARGALDRLQRARECGACVRVEGVEEVQHTCVADDTRVSVHFDIAS